MIGFFSVFLRSSRVRALGAALPTPPGTLRSCGCWRPLSVYLSMPAGYNFGQLDGRTNYPAGPARLPASLLRAVGLAAASGKGVTT